MRIQTQQLTPEQLEALPRTTRWRAAKRGWVAFAYHEKLVIRNDVVFQFFASDVFREARMVVAIERRKGVCFPSHLENDDLIQECVIEAWRKSGRAEFFNAGYRVSVMRGRLWDLRKSRRWEFSLEEEPCSDLEYQN
ncbi:MAG: hypothetical protein HY231_23675 [Acidobacteria bacterium]|nr:hypothetical protein [Acidobacteriota bacterium]